MNQIRTLLRHNLPAKLLAIFAAAVMWVFVMNEQNPSINQNITVPIHMINVPENFTVDPAEANVRLKVRASRSLMASYNVDDFEAYVDLSNAKEGVNKLKIQTRTPSGFEVVEMSDETLEVHLDQFVTREVKLLLSYTGNAADNLKVESISAVISAMEVNGPKSLIDTVEYVSGVVDISDMKENFEASVSLTPINKDGVIVEGVTLAQYKIPVTVKLYKDVVKKAVALHPISTGELPAGLTMQSIKVAPNKVEITGEPAVLDKISTIDTMPVDLSKINSSSIIDINLNLPDGVKAAQSNVQVLIDVEKDVSKTSN